MAGLWAGDLHWRGAGAGLARLDHIVVGWVIDVASLLSENGPMIYRKTIALLLAPLLMESTVVLAEERVNERPHNSKSVVVTPFVDHLAKNHSGQSRAARPKSKSRVERWVNWNDYPSRALREEYGGHAALWVTVNVAGRVSACEVTKSTGHENLDKVACKSLRRRARFEPALDYHGKPVTGIYPVSVSFYPPSWEKTQEARERGTIYEPPLVFEIKD